MPIINETQVRAATAANARRNEVEFPPFSRTGQGLGLAEILAEVDRIARLPLEESTTLPKEAFTSEEFYAWEVEQVFRKEWFCLAHVSQIPANGDFLNLDVFGEPLLVVRDKSGTIRVLSRVCPHRAMDIMPPEFGHEGHGPAQWDEEKSGCGQTRIFLCPYHSWTFELDGRLKACPEMSEAKGFQRDEWALAEFRSEVWNGFIFVNLDGKAPRSVSQQYADLQVKVGAWNLAEMEMVVSNEWEVPCNWKVLAENFMESYHHAGAHAKTLQPLMPAKGTWTEAEGAHSIRCHLPYREKLRKEIVEMEARGEHWSAFPPLADLEGEAKFEWGLFLGFPLFTFLVAPDQAVWYRILPQGPNQLNLLTTVLVPPSSKEHPDWERMLERGGEEAVGFHLEDMEVITAVQRSMYATGYQRGRLSHLEMPIWLLHRYLAARAQNSWPTEYLPGVAGQR
ncbi:MAG: aromatic ring-hydroxylating dioxygenase subunit alpha [Verrucomicrobiota bacterium]